VSVIIRAPRVDPGSKLLDRMNFNYNLIIKRIIATIALGVLVPIQINGKEEIRISRAITRCKHKNIFLENIKNVSKMRVRVRKLLSPTGSDHNSMCLTWWIFTIHVHGDGSSEIIIAATTRFFWRTTNLMCATATFWDSTNRID